MLLKYSRLFLLVLMLMLQLPACDDDINPIQFDPDAFPAAPLQVTLAIGDGIVVLSWSHAKPQEVDLYRVYRRSAIDTAFSLIDSTTAVSYTDSKVNNEVTYVYGVAAVKNKLEGKKAVSVPAVPTVFGLSINAGDEFTNSRSVVLTLIAPVGTTFMRISNDSLFQASVWEPYAAARRWTLSDNDGGKTVFALYRDSAGNETVAASRDSITLDTKASIQEVSENTNGQIRTVGETIQFSLSAGEPKGSATVDLGTARRNIRLFDDGSNGDDLADDGVYKRSFQIPVGLEVVGARVTGRFSDRLGNVAEALDADGLVTIQTAPVAVTLLDPAAASASTPSLQLSWTPSNDTDFSSYRLYRAISAGVSQSSTFVTSISARGTTSFQDSGLDENTLYFYILFVFDTGGLSAQSNEVSGRTLVDEPPSAVTLAQPDKIDSTTFELAWTQNTDNDFESYRVYRSTVSLVDVAGAPVGIINDAGTTRFEDSELQRGVRYFYVVLVFDRAGKSAASNEVGGQLP